MLRSSPSNWGVQRLYFDKCDMVGPFDIWPGEKFGLNGSGFIEHLGICESSDIDSDVVDHDKRI